jgi:hypothetical protein
MSEVWPGSTPSVVRPTNPLLIELLLRAVKLRIDPEPPSCV